MPNWPEGGQAAAAELKQAHVNKNGDWRYLQETWILPEPLTSQKKIEYEKSEGQNITYN